jgi:hypothetical protein
MKPELRNSDVSRIARRALAKQSVAGPHPDADLLTAFAERSVAARERQRVLAHLATCVDCREVVALAAPDAAEDLAAVAPAAGTRSWLPSFQMNFLRWGAVAAAVVLVATAVILEAPQRMTQSPKGELAARNSNETFVSAPADRKAQAAATAATQPSSSVSGTRADSAPKQTEVARLEDREGELAKLDAAQAQKKEKVAGTLAATRDKDEHRAYAKSAPVAEPALSAPMSPMVAGRPAQTDKLASAKGTVGAAAGGSADEKNATVALARQQPTGVAAPAKPAPAEENAETASANTYAVSRSANAPPAPEPEPARASGADLYGPGYAAAGSAGSIAGQGMRGELKPATLRWTVTSDGRVQRSRDGRNWDTVPVAKDVKFRALTTNGDEVWAGGARGALYYSADAGTSWRPYPLEHVTGDIIRLNVSGQMLVVYTSAGQTIEVSHDVFGDTAAKPHTSR